MWIHPIGPPGWSNNPNTLAPDDDRTQIVEDIESCSVFYHSTFKRFSFTVKPVRLLEPLNWRRTEEEGTEELNWGAELRKTEETTPRIAIWPEEGPEYLRTGSFSNCSTTFTVLFIAFFNAFYNFLMHMIVCLRLRPVRRSSNARPTLVRRAHKAVHRRRGSIMEPLLWTSPNLFSKSLRWTSSLNFLVKLLLN